MLRRKFYIGGKVWRYQVGSRYVKIKNPEGKNVYVAKEKILNNWMEVSPSSLKKYIEVALIANNKWVPRRHIAESDG